MKSNVESWEAAPEWARNPLYVRLRGMDERQRQLLRATVSTQERSRRGAVMALAASLAAVAVALGVWWGATGSGVQTYEAPAAGYKSVNLSDGSLMVLAAGSRATVSYTSTARRLEVVHGTGYFEVKRDAGRPFSVGVGKVSVTALGTAFSVAREGDRLNVTVTEGSVEVSREAASELAANSAPDERLRMRAGERASMTIGSASPAAQQPATRSFGGWRNGSIQFLNAPLAKVIAQVNVQAKHPIFIEDPRLATLNYSGTVFRERIDEWVAALPTVYPLRTVALNDGSVAVVSTESKRPE